MFCSKCGKQVGDKERFCTFCGESLADNFANNQINKTNSTQIQEDFEKFCSKTFNTSIKEDIIDMGMSITKETEDVPINNDVKDDSHLADVVSTDSNEQPMDKKKLLLVLTTLFVFVLVAILLIVVYRHNEYMNTYTSAFSVKNNFVMEIAGDKDYIVEINMIVENPFKSKIVNMDTQKFYIQKNQGVNVKINEGSYFLNLYQNNILVARYKIEVSAFSDVKYVLIEENRTVQVSVDKMPTTTKPTTTKPTTTKPTTKKSTTTKPTTTKATTTKSATPK